MNIEPLLAEKRIICLMGPTASGKTALAMALFDRLPIEIISVDSALIYRQMEIGTAKPTVKELAQYPHHLINICDPGQSYSAAQFKFQVTELIEQIHQKGKLPLLVGGTMLYFRTLLFGLSELPPANAEIRQQLLNQADKVGWLAMHQQLQRIDPVAAKRIHPNDPQRIQRALEVYQITGSSMTQLQQNSLPVQFPWPVTSVAVAPVSREILRVRIAVRFHQMLEQGFEQEVKQLMSRGDLNLEMPSMRSVGYRQMWLYLQGELDHEEMIFRAVAATRQLAKRQLTWLRGWPGRHTGLLNERTNDPVAEQQSELHWLDSLQDKLLDNTLNLLASQS